MRLKHILVHWKYSNRILFAFDKLESSVSVFELSMQAISAGRVLTKALETSLVFSSL